MSDIREFNHREQVAITLVGTVISTRYGAEFRIDDQPHPNCVPGWVFAAAVDAYKIEPPVPDLKPGTLLRSTQMSNVIQVLEGSARSGYTFRQVTGSNGGPQREWVSGVLHGNLLEQGWEVLA